MSLELATPPELEAEIEEMARLAKERNSNPENQETNGTTSSIELEATKLILQTREPFHFFTHLKGADHPNEWLEGMIDGEDIKNMDMGAMPGVMSPNEEKEWKRMLTRHRRDVAQIWKIHRSLGKKVEKKLH